MNVPVDYQTHLSRGFAFVEFSDSRAAEAATIQPVRHGHMVLTLEVVVDELVVPSTSTGCEQPRRKYDFSALKATMCG